MEFTSILVKIPAQVFCQNNEKRGFAFATFLSLSLNNVLRCIYRKFFKKVLFIICLKEKFVFFYKNIIKLHFLKIGLTPWN